MAYADARTSGRATLGNRILRSKRIVLPGILLLFVLWLSVVFLILWKARVKETIDIHGRIYPVNQGHMQQDAGPYLGDFVLEGSSMGTAFRFESGEVVDIRLGMPRGATLSFRATVLSQTDGDAGFLVKMAPKTALPKNLVAVFRDGDTERDMTITARRTRLLSLVVNRGPLDQN